MSNFKIYQVGGSVRDELMGRTPSDIDYIIITNENFEDTCQYLIDTGYKILVTGTDREIIRVDIGDKKMTDFTISKNLNDNLASRDFTINAIAKDITSGELIDPFNGINDILLKTLQFPVPTVSSFNSDPVRIFRALRFHITMNFHIEDTIWSEISKFPENNFCDIRLKKTTDELIKMFKHDSLQSIQVLYKLCSINKPLGQFIFNNIWLRANLKK